jgi:hypothetical protein
METKLVNNPLVIEWLAEIRRETTRETYIYRFSNFLSYHELTPEELLKLSPKDSRTLCLRYQNENTQKAENTRLGVLSTVSSFLAHHEKPIYWKRNQKLRPRGDVSSHIFTNGDLVKMFEVANIRDKSILALATSLGWELDGFVDLKKKTLRDLLDRAKSNNEQFIYFRNVRQKTGVPRVGIINPLAREWLEKWFNVSKNTPQQIRNLNSRRLTAKERVTDVFDLTGNGVRYALQILAKKANLKLTGRIRFHNLRKWTMAGLSRGGMNEFEVKYCVGKSIPMSDFVYLTNIEDAIKEKYPEAYENYLNLNPTVSPKAMTTLSQEIDQLKEENLELKQQLNDFKLNDDQVQALLHRIEKLEQKSKQK